MYVVMFDMHVHIYICVCVYRLGQLQGEMSLHFACLCLGLPRSGVWLGLAWPGVLMAVRELQVTSFFFFLFFFELEAVVIAVKYIYIHINICMSVCV